MNIAMQSRSSAKYCISVWQYLSFRYMFYLDTLQLPGLTESFLTLTLNVKKQHMYSMNQLVKVLQSSCFGTFVSSACQGSYIRS